MVLLDALRLVAAVGVVWEHTPRTPALVHTMVLGDFAVPFFTASAIFFLFDSLRRNPRRAFAPYAWSRFQRLYLPFLLWMLLYLAVRDAKHLWLRGGEPAIPLAPWLLWSGSALHLWFLPFLLAMCLLFFPLARLVAMHRRWRWPVALACAAGGLVWAMAPPPRGWEGSELYMMERGFHAVPAALWAAAIGSIWGDGLRPALRSRAAGLAALGAAVASMAILIVQEFGQSWVVPLMLLENVAGIGCLVLGTMAWENGAVRRVAAWSGCAFGIYLIHFMFIAACELLGMRTGRSGMQDVASFVVAVIASAAATWLLLKTRFTRWVVPS